MPSIKDTLIAGIRLFGSWDAVQALLHTFMRLGISIGISLFIALVLSFLSYKIKALEVILNPYIVLFKTVPLVSLIIILFVLVNFNIAPFIITILMVCPIMYQAFLSGLKSIDQSYIDVFLLEDNKPFLGIKYLYYPLTRGYIMLGLLQSLGLGIKVLVMAEFITQNKTGIGRLIYDARVSLAYDKIFAITIILVVIAYLLESVVKRLNRDLVTLE